LLVSLAFAVGLRTSMNSSQQGGNINSAPPRNKLQETIKEKVGKPTHIEEGVMTDKQRKHSKIFKHFEVSTGGRKLRDMAAESGSGDIYLVNPVPDRIGFPKPDLNTYLAGLTCKAEAVFLGTVISKKSQLLDEGTFTFTDYEITVTEILKNNSVSSIASNQTVTYTSPGGAIELRGKVISAIDYRTEPLQIGEQYLFYAG